MLLGEIQLNNINVDVKDLNNVIQDDYSSIYDAMMDEEYVIEYPDCSQIEEIHFKGEIIGIMGCKPVHSDRCYLLINEFYVIPKYRGNSAFYYSMLELSSRVNSVPLLRNPSRRIIDLLLKYNLAYEITDNVIASEIDLFMTNSDLFKDSKVIRDNTTGVVYHDLIGNLYDMNLCSMFFVEGLNFFSSNVTLGGLSNPRMVDVEKYNLDEKFENIDENYLNQLTSAGNKAIESIFDIELGLINALYDYTDYSAHLGMKDSFTDEYKEYLKEYGLSDKEGNKILDKIEKAIDNDELEMEHFHYRLNYLLNNPSKKATVGSDVKIGDKCPYCGNDIESYYMDCPECGYKLNHFLFD